MAPQIVITSPHPNLLNEGVGLSNIVSIRRRSPLKNRRRPMVLIHRPFNSPCFFLSFLAGNGGRGGGREDERSRGGGAAAGGEMGGRQEEEIGRSPQRRRRTPWPGRVRVISAASASPLCVNKGQFKESRRERREEDEERRPIRPSRQYANASGRSSNRWAEEGDGSGVENPS